MKRKSASALQLYRYHSGKRKARYRIRLFTLIFTVVLLLAFTSWRLQNPRRGRDNSSGNKGGNMNMFDNTDIPDNTNHLQETDHQNNWKLVLVNNDHPLTVDDSDRLARVQGQHQVDERIADLVISMIRDADKEGVDLLVCSSYRTVIRQQELFDEEVDKYITAGKSNDEALAEAAMGVAVPGHSEHNTGLALDIVTPKYQRLDRGFEETKAFHWLDQNAHKYGFILRYPNGKTPITKIKYEPWHYRFVGLEHASKIKEQGLTLEEYLENGSL